MLSFVVAPQIKKFIGDPEGLQRSLFITTGDLRRRRHGAVPVHVMNVKEQVQRDVAAPTLRQSRRHAEAQQAAAVAVRWAA